MKASELDGQLLNYWTARGQGLPLTESWRFATDGISCMVGDGMTPLRPFCPITHRAGVEHLMQQEGITAQFLGPGTGVPGEPWRAEVTIASTVNAEGKVVASTTDSYTGRTICIAGLRAYVAKTFGREVPELRV